MSNPAVIDKFDQALLSRLDPDGELNLAACLQCARCSSGCTMRDETDILPHQLNRMAIMGLEDELKRSKAIWMCVSCQTCVSRCPMEVNTPAMIDRIRQMTKEAPGDLRKVRIFNETMLGQIRKYGRTFELMLMAMYKLKSGDLFSDVRKFPRMLSKGKFRLLPPAVRGKAVAAIFGRVRARRAR